MSVDNGDKALPVVPPDKVILTVGDIKITAKQFDQMILSLPEQYRASAHGPGRKVFADSLVKIFLLAGEGQHRKLEETDLYKTQRMFQDANLLAAHAFEQIDQENKPAEADVHKFYEAHQAEYEQVHARQILVRAQGAPLPVKPGQKDLTDAEALAKAQDLRKKIQAGGDFAALASAESDDMSTATKGGDLGFFKRGVREPVVEEAAFALKAGETGDPVRGRMGYYLIKVEARNTLPFEQVRAELEQRIRAQATQKIMDEMQKKSTVVYDPEFFNIAQK